MFKLNIPMNEQQCAEHGHMSLCWVVLSCLMVLDSGEPAADGVNLIRGDSWDR